MRVCNSIILNVGPIGGRSISPFRTVVRSIGRTGKIGLSGRLRITSLGRLMGHFGTTMGRRAKGSFPAYTCRRL